MTSRVETPYSRYLNDREPLAAIDDTRDRVRGLTSPWSATDYERTYAPGKWTARQILTHLAQTEMALGTRARMALTVSGYTAQPFDQDRWLAHEGAMSGPEAAASFLALAAMNRTLFRSLSAGDRQTLMSHPEYGSISVDWIIHTIAGHQINHLIQLEGIGGAGQDRR